MLAHTFNQHSWLKEEESSSISLTRWQQQINLAHNLFEAEAVFIMQVQGTDCQIVCERDSQKLNCYNHDIYSYSKFLHQLDIDFPALENNIDDSERVISQSIYWPDGSLFGYLTICHPKVTGEANALVLASITNMLQAELKNVFLTHQIEALSMQDSQTCMLNTYGFSMMAPRQLSLSRRFGSHAGLVIVDMKLETKQRKSVDNRDKDIRQLARIISDTIRAADVAARLSEGQFIILAFLDHESNLTSMVTRLNKQISRFNSELEVHMGKSFFTPDSHFELEPMLKVAEEDLASNKEKPSLTLM